MLDDKDIIKLSEVFVTKEDLKDELKKFVTKKDFDEFRDESLSKLDEILEKVTPLPQEKIIKEEQEKKQKRVLEIHNNALKNNKILSEEETAEIYRLQVF